jgi:hypothetical protein
LASKSTKQNSVRAMLVEGFCVMYAPMACMAEVRKTVSLLSVRLPMVSAVLHTRASSG